MPLHCTIQKGQQFCISPIFRYYTSMASENGHWKSRFLLFLTPVPQTHILSQKDKGP